MKGFTVRGKWNHVAPTTHQSAPADNTSKHVTRQVEAHRTAIHHGNGPIMLIHPESAMEIAAWWMCSSNPGIAAFASTGTITDTLIPELMRERKSCSGEDSLDIDALLDYLEASQTMIGVTYKRTDTPEDLQEKRSVKLMEVYWDEQNGTYLVKARATGGWSYFEDERDQLSELLSLAHDVMTGGE